MSVIKLAVQIVMSSESCFRGGKVTLEKLVRLSNSGFSDGNDYIFNRTEKQGLRNWLKELDIDPVTFNSTKGTKLEQSHKSIFEKAGAIPSLSELALLKKVSGKVKINDCLLSHPICTHIQIALYSIEKVEADSIIFVENIDAFLNIHNLIIPELKGNVLACFRGSKQTAETTRWARETCQEQDITLIAWMDYDLAGLCKAMELHPNKVVVPNVQSLINTGLKGNLYDYNKQTEYYESRQEKMKVINELKPYLEHLENIKKSFVQERLLSAGITHDLIDTNK